MGKKDRKDIETSIKIGKKKIIPFSFLNVKFDTIDRNTVKRHLLFLIIASLITKLLILFVTTSVFHSFIDFFDFQYYFEHALLVTNGKIPYVDFSFDYPPLAFIPIFLAFIPAFILNNIFAFVYSFQILMVVCDTIIIICIYFIGLKIYNEKTAFIAAVLYSTAFSVAYFVLTKYDAFPTCILMIAVLFTIYGMNVRGYFAAIFGFFTKIFPAISLPFMVLYNAKTTSLKKELFTVLKIGIPVTVILLLPIVLLKPGVLISYFSSSLVRTDLYVNTASYSLYAYLHDVLNLGISTTVISNIMYFLMGVAVLVLVVIAYNVPGKNPRHLVKLLLLSIFIVVFCMKYHSPQYIVWFTPFVCLLIADTLYGIVTFYFTQILTYLEFPLLFGTLYTNGTYVSPMGSYGWYLALFFFTLLYAAYIVLIYLAVKPLLPDVKKYKVDFEKIFIKKR
jgi:hypothetical protein